MEEAVAIGTFEAGQFDMLPKLIASAGYRSRDNVLITRSVDSVTGAPSLANPYISSSRSAVTTEIGISWSLLDFGQSYYAARQNADRVLIAGERRRGAARRAAGVARTCHDCGTLGSAGAEVLAYRGLGALARSRVLGQA